MSFTKIKLAKGSVLLEWTDEGVSDTKKTSLNSFDEPEKEFTEAMQALAPIACKLLELPPSYTDGMTVLGVALTYNETQGRGCVITCSKSLENFNAPLLLNTPHLAEDAEYGPIAPTELVRAIDELEMRAQRFRQGMRLQADIFSDEEAA